MEPTARVFGTGRVSRRGSWRAFVLVLVLAAFWVTGGPADRPSPSGEGANQPPTVSFSAASSGLGVTLDASASSDPEGGPLSYSWDYGDGTTGSGTTDSHTYTSPGTRIVTLTATDDGGAVATVSKEMSVDWGIGAQDTGALSDDLKLLSTSTLPYPEDRLDGTTKLLINTAGAVYEGWRFDRLVEVHAANVTFRNCRFEGVHGNPRDSALLLVANDRRRMPIPSATVEDSTLIPAFPNDTVDGVRGSNFTLRRVEISKTVDGAHIYGAGTYTDPHAGNVLIEDSWIHDLSWYDNGTNDDGTHNDGIQVVGGKNVRLVDSRIDGTVSNAALQVTQTRNKVDSILIQNSVLSGGSCTVNVSDHGGSSPITGIRLLSNTFVKGSSRRSDCAMLVDPRSLPESTARGNTWDDSGSPPKPTSTVPPLA